jgi:MFS family permease
MQSIPTNGHLTAGAIAARLDRLPQTFTVCKLIILLSFGFFFELYDLLFTGNIAPGLVKSGILKLTTPGLFGSTDVASFVAALFAGLFLGAIACGFLADKIRSARDLHLFTAVVYGDQCPHGLPKHSLRAQPLALPVWH